MITAVDTSVLLDVFGADAAFGRASQATLRRCLQEGQVVACEVVWAETVSVFPDGPAAAAALREAGVEFNACGEECALIAGMVFASYRARGGKRDRAVADFLVGAHAMVRADRLLTRDRGFYRSYFVGLEILDPTARKSSR